MPLLCRLALVGLSPVDRSLLEALFLQPLQREPGYVLVTDLNRADLIIASADETYTVRNLQERRLSAPVLLIGDADGDTGWPVLPRPIQLHAVMDVVNQMEPGLRVAVGRASAPKPVMQTGFEMTQPFAPSEFDTPAPRRSGAPAPAARTGFEMTRPFDPSESGAPAVRRSGAPAPAARTGFEMTRPFDPSESGAPAPRRSAAGHRAMDDRIDARSVLMWRDAPAGQTGRPVPASPPHPEPGVPAMAGFEPTRDAAALGERIVVPANWQDLAREQALKRAQASQPQALDDDDEEEAEGASSSFADPSDHPTAPQALVAPGRVQAILLVMQPRTHESSLVKALRHFGCHVDCVPDAEAALKRLASQSYRLVILDDRSLGGATLRACRALHKRGRVLGQRMRIVIVARERSLLRRFFARLAGCDAWMTTPLRKSSLKQVLRGAKSGRTA